MMSEDVLLKRISTDDNISSKGCGLIVYEFSKNENYLSQYYKLREKCYREDLHLDSFSGEEDEQDRQSLILIVRIGNKVIAGSRLTISSPDNRILLPMENEDFLLKDIFPNLLLEQKSYCEISRFVIRPEFRKGDICKNMIEFMVNRAEKILCSYQFSVSPLIQSRVYRNFFHQIGRKNVILSDITIPYKSVYKHLNEDKIYLSLTDLLSKLN